MTSPDSFTATLAGYSCVKVVQSFEELVSTPFADGVNALCWRRELAGDFEEVVARVVEIAGDEEITSLDEESLLSLELSEAGEAARAVLIEDLQRLAERGLDPNLDCLPRYPSDGEAEALSTDVYGWHADSAPVIADTYLCSYTEAASEGLRWEDAIAVADVPAVRAELLQRYGGADDAGFRAYLREHFHDLHYIAKDGAVPFAFGLGNLWRIANQCPGSPVPPCVHRAPATVAGRPPRLLLIS